MPWSEYRGPKFLVYPPHEGFMCQAVVSEAGTNRAYFIERLPLYAGRSETKSRVVAGMTFTVQARVSEDGRDLRASVVIEKDERLIGRYGSVTRLLQAGTVRAALPQDDGRGAAARFAPSVER